MIVKPLVLLNGVAVCSRMLKTGVSVSHAQISPRGVHLPKVMFLNGI